MHHTDRSLPRHSTFRTLRSSALATGLALVFAAAAGAATAPATAASGTPAHRPAHAASAPRAASAASAASAAAPAYENIEDYFDERNDGSYERWLDAETALVDGFNQVCGDTMCEGDYADLQSLSLYCVVASATGVLRSCTWVFGGSYATVSERTGTLALRRRTFACALPLGHGATASQLLDVLSPKTDGASPIDRPLPGTDGSAYDAISIKCL